MGHLDKFMPVFFQQNCRLRIGGLCRITMAAEENSLENQMKLTSLFNFCINLRCCDHLINVISVALPSTGEETAQIDTIVFWIDQRMEQCFLKLDGLFNELELILEIGINQNYRHQICVGKFIRNCDGEAKYATIKYASSHDE